MEEVLDGPWEAALVQAELAWAPHGWLVGRAAGGAGVVQVETVQVVFFICDRLVHRIRIAKQVVQGMTYI